MKPLNIMTSSEGAPLPKRVCLRKEELETISKEELVEKWLLQDQYINSLKLKSGESESSELVSLRESEEKLKQQQLEATRKENILVMRLTTKEQEMQEYASQIQELKQSALPSLSQLRSALLDPAVNAMFERMRKEVDSLKARLEETQNELSAWKFTPDSNTGKRLMAKCRLLYVENEELGKLISSGRTAKLEGDLALQKNFSEEMKKSQAELDDFLLELDEDVEGMQSTIYLLQQQLKEAKDQVAKLQAEKLHSPVSQTPPNSSVPFSQNGLQDSSKRTEGSPSPVSPQALPTLNAPASVHPSTKETSSPPAKLPAVIKEEYIAAVVKEEYLSPAVKDEHLNGNEPASSPGTPLHEHYDEPVQVEGLGKQRPTKSPERTSAQTEQSQFIVRTSSPLPLPPHGPSITNGKCQGVHLKNISSEVHSEVPSDFGSMEVDVTSTLSPPPALTALVPTVCCSDATSIIIVQNSEVQEEAVNLTISSRDMTPPSSPSVCTEEPLKLPKESTDSCSSPRDFSSAPFEPAVSVDIDDDREVQVAQTLACWAASAKKSETHQAPARYLGNGEAEDTSSVSEGDL